MFGEQFFLIVRPPAANASRLICHVRVLYIVVVDRSSSSSSSSHSDIPDPLTTAHRRYRQLLLIAATTAAAATRHRSRCPMRSPASNIKKRTRCCQPRHILSGAVLRSINVSRLVSRALEYTIP
jgi:hypothetical protein